MSSRASIARHPIHPMLIVFPIGLWVFSFICCIVRLAGGGSGWETTSLYTQIGGVIGALLAAVPGFIDYLTIHKPSTKKVATVHMVLNLAIAVIMLVSWWLRATAMNGAGLWLFVIGIAMLLVSGWLGGSLVYIHKMGVEAAGPQAGELPQGMPHPTPG